MAVRGIFGRAGNTVSPSANRPISDWAGGLISRLRMAYFGPWLIGIVAASLLSIVPQARETYLAIYADGAWLQAVLGLVTILLLCAQIDCWHRSLGMEYINRKYPDHASLQLDWAMSIWNANFGRLAAVLPLAGLISGVMIALLEGWRDSYRLETSNFAPDADLPFPLALPDQPIWIFATPIAMLLGLTTIWGFRVLQGRQSEPLVFARSMRKTLVFIVSLITIAALVLPALPFQIVTTYSTGFARAIGPLGTCGIALITLVGILMFMTKLTTLSGLPVVSIAAISFTIFFIVQILSNGRNAIGAAPSLPKMANPALHDRRPITKAFEDWLAARNDRKDYGDTPYPVFIVAAQGGGIYAASTASAFLTRMQDECSGFGQHVFAISGVSGGAVGATVFGELLVSQKQVESFGCSPSIRERGPLAKRAAEIMATDHLSPAILQIWPDFTRLLPLTNQHNRSTALEHSLACAFEKSRAGEWECPYQRLTPKGTPGLRRSYHDHWTPNSWAPAQILNTTWSETGYRVAFAPFPLHAISDGTLFSHPSGGATTDFGAFGIKTSGEPSESLIEAAFISARFPGIVPAYSFSALSGQQPRNWNLVDGGYIDNSGATTALELYKALAAHSVSKQFREKKLGEVDIYLVMLTDAATDPNLTTVGSGTDLNDTVAPLAALLSVRQQAANRAVRRSIDEVGALRRANQTVTAMTINANELTGRSNAASPVLVVNVDQTTFRLPLGWKLSPRTIDIIDRLLGDPDSCKYTDQKDDPSPVELAPTDARRIISDNGCVRSRLRNILSRTAPPLPKLAP